MAYEVKGVVARSKGAPLMLTLPEDTVVQTGHGKDTSIAAEVCRVR
jgi:hypothetical protein